MTSKFTLPLFEYPSEAEDAINACWITLGSWRKFLIAVDGRDGAGKTAFSRLLSFRCNMPVFEGDEFLLKRGSLNHRKELGRVMSQRLAENRPLIFDSILAHDVCEKLGVTPDYTIRVASVGILGMNRFRARYEEYETRVAPDLVLILPCQSPQRPADCGMVGQTRQTKCANCPKTRWLQRSPFPWLTV